jgi:hypothetical protein
MVDFDAYFTIANGDVLTKSVNFAGLLSWITYNPVKHILGGPARNLEGYI